MRSQLIIILVDLLIQSIKTKVLPFEKEINVSWYIRENSILSAICKMMNENFLIS